MKKAEAATASAFYLQPKAELRKMFVNHLGHLEHVHGFLSAEHG